MTMRKEPSECPYRTPTSLIGLMVLGILALALYRLADWRTTGWYPRVLPERAVVGRPVQIASDGYVSSEACKACHPSQYASWHDSYHRTMTQVATPDTIVPDFAGTQVREVPGRAMALEQRNGQFWATLDDPDWTHQGVTPPRIERQVVMTTGSHHQQVYWYPTGRGRLLGQLPAEYLIEERRWIPRTSVLLHPPGPPFAETGSWNSTCIACHATKGAPQLDTSLNTRLSSSTGSASTTAVEFGIACEACHGPGADHIRQNRNPWRRYQLHLTGTRDPSIVQPAQLTASRSSQVCGQCHSVWEFFSRQDEQSANLHGAPFRPGDDLAATRLVVQPMKSHSPAMDALINTDPQFIRDSFWPDGMIRVSGREYNGLIESPCYKNAPTDEQRMTCFSCHDLHKGDDDRRSTREWANHQIAPGMNSNEACLQCHSTFAADVPAHTRHAASSSGSSCYNCHMPYTTYGLLKTLRSHQISVPSATVTAETGRPNACNLCHLDKTLQWTADTLATWYGMPKPALQDDENRIAASLLWMFKGDAGVRAIAVQSMNWPPAQEASGTGWMAPYLAQLLDDPYDAVRFITFRSLRSVQGFSQFEYDFLAPHGERLTAASRAISQWRRSRGHDARGFDPALLFDARGDLRLDEIIRLVKSRDNRPVFLRE
jgi:hypothetical protein